MRINATFTFCRHWHKMVLNQLGASASFGFGVDGHLVEVVWFNSVHKLLVYFIRTNPFVGDFTWECIKVPDMKITFCILLLIQHVKKQKCKLRKRSNSKGTYMERENIRGFTELTKQEKQVEKWHSRTRIATEQCIKIHTECTYYMYLPLQVLLSFVKQ